MRMLAALHNGDGRLAATGMVGVVFNWALGNLNVLMC